jgi:YVTN family beta-propeller protein
MQLPRASVAFGAFVALVLVTACQAGGLPNATPLPAPARPAAAASPSARPARAAASVVPSPSPATALSTPLTGEFGLTANADDHTLSVIPIGVARPEPPVQLDFSPGSVATSTNTAWAVAADDSPGGHSVARLNLASPQPATDVDVGGPVHAFSVGGGASSPLVLVSDSNNTLRTLDPSTGTLGASVPLGNGPHAVAFDATSTTSQAQIFVSNAGDGSVSVLDSAGTTVQNTLGVGGQPIGMAATRNGHLWIADGTANDVYELDPVSGRAEPPIQVGDGLVSLAATPDAHYLVLASSDPQHALYSVDLFKAQLGQTTMAVNSLAVPGGVLGVATGAEVTLAYATTGDDKLVYWDLVNNAIAQSVDIGHNPLGLALGLVMPNNAIAPSALVGGGTISSTTSGGGAAGGTGGTTAANTTSSTAGATTGGGTASGASPNTSMSSAPASTTSNASSATAPSSSGAAPAAPPVISNSSSPAGGTGGGGGTGVVGGLGGSSTTAGTSGGAAPASGGAGGGATTGSNNSGISTIGSISNPGVGGQGTSSGAPGVSSTGGTANTTSTGPTGGAATGAGASATGGGATSAVAATGGAAAGSAPAGPGVSGGNGAAGGTGASGNNAPIPSPTTSASHPTVTATPSRAAAATPVPSPAANRHP